MKLILFDVDKTLITSNGLDHHVNALEKALENVYGIKAKESEVDYAGSTNGKIVYDILKKHNVEEKIIFEKLDELREVMLKFYNEKKDKTTFKLELGVKNLLEKLENEGFLLGLITGNTQSIARLKLESLDINHFFKVGGFGDDAFERSEVLQAGIDKAKKLREIDDVFVFGDTPKDIDAAKKNDVKVIGVATGIYSEKELKEAGADLVVKNLTEIDKIMNFLLQ